VLYPIVSCCTLRHVSTLSDHGDMRVIFCDDALSWRARSLLILYVGTGDMCGRAGACTEENGSTPRSTERQEERPGGPHHID